MTAITEILINVQNKGLLANRPAPAINGRNYWATDNLTMYQDNGTTWETLFTIPSNTAVTVEEVDGAPTGTATKIVFPNGTLSFAGSVATYTPSGGSVTVQEQDGSPSATATTLKFPNGSITDEGGGVLSIRDLPVGYIGAHAFHSTNQNIVAAGTALSFNSEVWDTDGFHSTVTNTSRFTVPPGLGGKYLLHAVAQDQTGGAAFLFLKNGAQVGGGGHSSTTAAKATSVDLVVDLAAGDYVEFMGAADSGTHEVYGQTPQSWQTASMSITKLDAGKVGSGVGAKAHNTGAQSIPSATWTAVTLASEVWDTDNFHSTASNTSRMTIPAGLGGKYRATAGTAFDAGGTGDRYIAIRVNGAVLTGGSTVDVRAPHASLTADRSGSLDVDVVAGDYVELYVYQDSGGALNVQRSFLSLMRIDALPPAQGAMVLLDSKIASSSASLDFTNFVSSRYDQYVFEVVGLVPATNAVDFYMRMSTNGGSSYDSANNYRAAIWAYATTGTVNASYDPGSAIAARGTAEISNAATGGVDATIKLFDPASTVRHKRVLADFTYMTAQVVRSNVAGSYFVTTAVDSVRFLFSSGNIASGTIRVYGIAK